MLMKVSNSILYVANFKISNPSDVSHDVMDCSASDSETSSELSDESQV